MEPRNLTGLLPPADQRPELGSSPAAYTARTTEAVSWEFEPPVGPANPPSAPIFDRRNLSALSVTEFSAEPVPASASTASAVSATTTESDSPHPPSALWFATSQPSLLSGSFSFAAVSASIPQQCSAIVPPILPSFAWASMSATRFLPARLRGSPPASASARATISMSPSLESEPDSDSRNFSGSTPPLVQPIAFSPADVPASSAQQVVVTSLEASGSAKPPSAPCLAFR